MRKSDGDGKEKVKKLGKLIGDYENSWRATKRKSCLFLKKTKKSSLSVHKFLKKEIFLFQLLKIFCQV